MKILIILGSLLIYLYLTISVLFYSPKIWPDEAYLADIAQNFATTGRLGTDLWGDMFEGTRNNFYWYPPLYILTLAASFKIFGFSILTQRSLSIFIAGGLLILLFILLKKIILNLGGEF